MKWLGPGGPGPSPSLSTCPSFSLPLPSFPLPPSPFPLLRFSLPFCFFPSASSFPLSPPFLLSLPFSSSSLLFLYLLFEVARAWKTRAFPFPFHLSFLLFTFIFLSFTSFPLPPPQILPSLLLLSPCLLLPPFHPFSFPFSSSSLHFLYLLFEVARAWRTRTVPFPFHLSFLLFTFTFLSFTSFPLPFSDSPFPSASFLLPSSFPLSPPFLLSLPSLPLLCIRLYLLFEVARAWKTRAFPFPFHLFFLLFTFIFLSFTSFPLPPSQILPSLLLLSPCFPPSPFPHPFSFPFPSLPLLCLFLYLLFEVARAWKTRAFPFPFHLSFLSLYLYFPFLYLLPPS